MTNKGHNYSPWNRFVHSTLKVEYTRKQTAFLLKVSKCTNREHEKLLPLL